MAFNLDFNDTFEGYGDVQDGWYEVVVNRCNEDATPSGAEYTEFDLIIRNDVDQPSKNSHIFHKVWKAKKDNKYNMKTFNTIGKACQLQNGKGYASFEELLADYKMKTALILVKNEESDYNGKTYQNLNVKTWDSSKMNGLNHGFKDGGKSGAFDNGTPDAVDISEDDLPF